MFHIKICGVRLQQDVDAAADSAADAIGLNFFPSSIRFVDPADESTRLLSEHAANRKLVRVGVFVNESIETIAETVQRVGLDVVQLHGDETVAMATSLINDGYTVIRAVKLPIGDLSPDEIELRTATWRAAGALLLLDADAGAAHGGSGKTLDWNAIRRWSLKFPGDDWVLAGGLHPENVAEAVRQSGAVRVDVASGVEQPRGTKSADRIRSFAEIASRQFTAK